MDDLINAREVKEKKDLENERKKDLNLPEIAEDLEFEG